MSYQAIARRHRPQRFEDVVGQTHVTQTLQNAIRLDRIHHAFLFCGTRGVGKTTGARILAKALQCERGPSDNPCNECDSCKEITRGSHPDVSEIDGASNNRVDDVRELIETVRYLPTKGRYRIYIIDEVHMVTQQAFNALLKTLEEPPAHVVFIFATTEPQRIPDTVLSRCQRFDFKMLSQRVVYDRLRQIVDQEGIEVPDSVLMPIAREAAGSMRDGQSLLDQVLSFADGAITEQQAVEILGLVDRRLLHELLDAIVRGDPPRTLESYAEIMQFGVEPRTVANDLLGMLRHATVAALLRDTERVIDLPAEEVALLRALAEAVGVEALQRRFDVLSTATDEIARSNTPDLVLEMALIRMARIRPYVPVETLVERLLELERRVMRAGVASPPTPPAERRPPLAGAYPGQGGPGPVARDTRPPKPTYAVQERTPPPSPAAKPGGRKPSVVERAAARARAGGASVAPAAAPVEDEPPHPGAPTPAPEATAPAAQVAPAQAAPTQAAPTQAPAAPAPEPAAATPPAAPAPTRPEPQAEPAPAPTPEAAPPAAAQAAPAPTEAAPTDPEPRPASIDVDADRWLAFVGSLPGSTGAIVAEGRFLGADHGVVRLGFPKPSTMALAEKKLTAPELVDAATAFFGGNLRLEFVADDRADAPPSPGEASRQAARQRHDEREQRARSHPKIELIRSVFPGAEISHIKHLQK